MVRRSPEKAAAIERDTRLLSDFANMLENAFAMLAPIPPDAEEVGIGKFKDTDSPRAIQFSLGYEQERIIGFVGITPDNGTTYDEFYRRDAARDTWEDASTGNPTSNSMVLTALTKVGLGHDRLPDEHKGFLNIIGEQEQPSDKDVFETASMVFAPASSNVRRHKRYDYSDIVIDGEYAQQLDFSIYETVDCGERLVEARITSDIVRDEIPCVLVCLFRDDEYDQPRLEIRITGDGIDETIIPTDVQATLHELMRLLRKLVDEKREPYIVYTEES